MKRRKTLVASILALSILIGLTGCGHTQSSKRVVRIDGFQGSFDLFAQIIIMREGLMEKYLPEDVVLEWVSIASGSEKRDALLSGQLDITDLAVAALATSLQNDFPFVYVTYLGSNRIGLYCNDEDVNTMEDMTSDMKISVPSIGTGPHTAFLVSAVQVLGSADRFKNSMVTMANADGVNAVISETAGVDAVVVSFPTSLAAEAAENVHLVRDLSDGIIEYGVGTVVCTTEEFAKNNSDVIDAYLAAYDEAIRMMREDRETCIDIIVETFSGCDEQRAAEMLDYYLLALEYDGEKYDKLMNFLYDNGILEERAATFADIPKYEREK